MAEQSVGRRRGGSLRRRMSRGVSSFRRQVCFLDLSFIYVFRICLLYLYSVYVFHIRLPYIFSVNVFCIRLPYTSSIYVFRVCLSGEAPFIAVYLEGFHHFLGCTIDIPDGFIIQTTMSVGLIISLYSGFPF